MATRKKKVSNDDCVIVKGSHLTVATYKDGSTILTWDDEALTRDVREAIEKYEMSQLKPAVKAKAVTRKKKVEKAEVLNSVELSTQVIEKAKKAAKKTTKGKTK